LKFITENMVLRLRSTPASSPNLNVLAAVRMGMWTIKLFSNKVFQFLIGGAS